MEIAQNFVMVPNDIVEDESLTPSEKQLYCLILRRASKNGVCWDAQVNLAKKLHLKSSRQIRNLIKKLVERGLIQVISQSGRFSTNNYIPLVTAYGKYISPHTGNVFTPHKGNGLPTNKTKEIKEYEKKGTMSHIAEILRRKEV